MMKRKVLKISFSFLLLLMTISAKSCIAEAKSHYFAPLQSLLRYLNSPMQITIMTSWNISTRTIFTRKFWQQTAYERHFQLAFTQPSIDNFPVALEEHQQLIVVDLEFTETITLLKDVGNKVSNKIKWIALGEWHMLDERELLHNFQSLPLLPNSEFYCILKTKIDDTLENVENQTSDAEKYAIVEAYKLSLEQDLIFETFGTYTKGHLIVQQKERDTAIRRRNLMGAKLRASLVITHNDTVAHLDDYRNRHIDTISKVCYFLTNYLCEYVNGSLQYKFVDSWGYKDENTSRWSGMIGDLTENRSEIGASALFYTADRIQYIDYIAMPTPTRSKFVFRSPKLSFTDNVYLLPFDKLVWYSLFGLMIVTALVLLLVTWLESKLDINKFDEQLKENPAILHSALLDVMILVFGASCQQGSAVAPQSFTARLIMMLIFITLMFLYTSYSANIVALLQSPSRKIRTLDDLLHSRLQLAADDTVFNHYYFRHATEPTRRAIYERKIRKADGSENFLPLEDGVEKIREGLFAFHFETGVGYKILEELFLEDEKCGLQEIQYLQVVDPWYAIQKNSSYKELFKVGMMRIHEHGLQERENFALYTRKPKCVSGGGKFITASLVDTKPTMLVLLWGYAVAFIILLIERVIYKIKFRMGKCCNGCCF